MRKFHIIAEGIGFGHVSRCAILSKELEKSGEVKIFTFGPAYEFAKSLGLDAVKLNFNFQLASDENGVNIEKNVLDYIYRLSPVEFAKLSSTFGKDRPDAIIVDSNLFGLAAAKLYGKARIFFLANNTDLSIFTRKLMLGSGAAALSRFVVQTPQRIFVPDLPPPYCITYPNINFFDRPERFSFSGPLARRIADSGSQYDFVSLGGTDGKAAQSLILNSGLNFASCSLSGKNIRRFQKQDYEKCFSGARVVVGHGGHSTIMECVLAGKPMLILHDGSYAERVNNAKQVAALGLGVELDARFANKKVLEHALEEAHSMKSRCRKFARFARSFNAAAEIAKQLSS